MKKILNFLADYWYVILIGLAFIPVWWDWRENNRKNPRERDNITYEHRGDSVYIIKSYVDSVYYEPQSKPEYEL